MTVWPGSNPIKFMTKLNDKKGLKIWHTFNILPISNQFDVGEAETKGFL
jgi:hypothetical protein